VPSFAALPSFIKSGTCVFLANFTPPYPIIKPRAALDILSVIPPSLSGTSIPNIFSSVGKANPYSAPAAPVPNSPDLGPTEK
jgi:hypothetical protein